MKILESKIMIPVVRFCSTRIMYSTVMCTVHSTVMCTGTLCTGGQGAERYQEARGSAGNSRRSAGTASAVRGAQEEGRQLCA